MLTMPPGPDVAPFHDRQIVVLDRSRWVDWLDAGVPSMDVLRTLPAGTLDVVQVGWIASEPGWHHAATSCEVGGGLTGKRPILDEGAWTRRTSGR